MSCFFHSEPYSWSVYVCCPVYWYEFPFYYWGDSTVWPHLTIYLLRDIWIVFSLVLLWLRLLWIFKCRSLWRQSFLFTLNKYLGMAWLGQCNAGLLFFLRNWYFSKVQFAILCVRPQNYSILSNIWIGGFCRVSVCSTEIFHDLRTSRADYIIELLIFQRGWEKGKNKIQIWKFTQYKCSKKFLAT